MLQDGRRTEDDDWFQVIDANLNSCFFCCREEVKLMQPSGGAIVNVSSVAGMRDSLPQQLKLRSMQSVD
ncbi:MAG: SDR family NAD(P)-dependent oxidoreductase [Mediterraneibacter gnavus]